MQRMSQIPAAAPASPSAEPFAWGVVLLSVRMARVGVLMLAMPPSCPCFPRGACAREAAGAAGQEGAASSEVCLAASSRGHLVMTR